MPGNPVLEREGAAIGSRLGPFLHVQATSYSCGPGMIFGPYRFEGIVRAEDLPAAATAREYRGLLLDRAEDAIDALDELGWQLTRYPDMRFTGEVSRFQQTPDGKLAGPSRQRAIALHVSIEVHRPR
jgi:hypothetical protein